MGWRIKHREIKEEEEVYIGLPSIFGILSFIGLLDFFPRDSSQLL